MCPEPENPFFSQIFFEHGYLTCYSTYLLENLCVCSLDIKLMEGSMSHNVDTRFSCFLYCM